MSRIYVVDQNVMRKPVLRALLDNEPLSTFVVPDVAFLEMSKSGDWQGTMRPSLAAFSGRGHRLQLSISVGEALRHELGGSAAITAANLLSSGFSAFARGLVDELNSGVPGPSMQAVQARFSDARARTG